MAPEVHGEPAMSPSHPSQHSIAQILSALHKTTKSVESLLAAPVRDITARALARALALVWSAFDELEGLGDGGRSEQ